MFWGQYLAHDVSQTGESSESFPIPVPPCDPYFDKACTGTAMLPFSRSASVPGSGANSSNPRQFLNFQTSFVDASNVYGTSAARSNPLRTFTGGLMKVSDDGRQQLPKNTAGVPMANEGQCPVPTTCPALIRMAGDHRANENPVLFSLHTVFMREHNRQATLLAAAHPSWNDATLFEEARRRVSALQQKVTFYEYIPAILGRPLAKAYSGYDSSVDPSLGDAFNTATFRYGHSEISGVMNRVQHSGAEVAEGHLPIRDALFRPTQGLPGGSVEPVIRGAVRQPSMAVDTAFADDVRNFLFGAPHGTPAGDLPARNVQRGRDHGLPDYNSMRASLGLPRVTSWAGVTRDAAKQALLAQLYSSVDDVDAYVGGLAEDHVAGSVLGPLFYASSEQQWTRTRDGDRFYFEAASAQFSGEERAEILGTRLADIIRRNTGMAGDDLQPFVFNRDVRGDLDVSPAFPAAPSGFSPHGTHVGMAGRYRFLWRASSSSVEFVVQARTVGWVGIGFNPTVAGVMGGADIVIGRVIAATGVGEVMDCYARDTVGRPMRDATEMSPAGANNVLSGSSVSESSDGWTTLRFTKPRNSGDAWDSLISSTQPTTIIMALNPTTDELWYHGPDVATASLTLVAPGTVVLPNPSPAPGNGGPTTAPSPGPSPAVAAIAATPPSAALFIVLGAVPGVVVTLLAYVIYRRSCRSPSTIYAK